MKKKPKPKPKSKSQRRPLDIFVVMDGIHALRQLSISIRMGELHRQIAQRPYPSAAIITDMVSKEFPEMPQKHVYNVVQHIKQYLKQHDLIADLQKQTPVNN